MTGFSFRKPFLFWFAVVLLLSSYVIWRTVSIPPADQAEYEQKAADQLERHLERKSKEEKALPKQVRYHVTKKIWLSEKPPRAACEIQGSRSEVNITMKQSETRISETFFDVQGIIQQELFYKDANGQEYVMRDNGIVPKRSDSQEAVVHEEPVGADLLDSLKEMQRFRYFEAEKAIYDYHTHTLVAHEVTFWTYVTEGHELVESTKNLWPEATGSASAMTITHKGTSLKGAQFAAEDLIMQVENKDKQL